MCRCKKRGMCFSVVLQPNQALVPLTFCSIFFDYVDYSWTAGQPQGGTRSIHDGGSDEFFWVENLHARYFFGSRDLSRIFLGLKKYAYFLGSYLRANFSFRVFVAISGSEKYSFELFFSDVCSVFLYFFGLEILMPGIFLGLKFQACVFFWVCNMKLRRTPPRHVYFEYPPGRPTNIHFFRTCSDTLDLVELNIFFCALCQVHQSRDQNRNTINRF